MRNSVKRAIGYVPGLFGYEIRKRRPESAVSVVGRLQLATILDVGANLGQFASDMRRSNPTASIHSFEPIPRVEAELRNGFKADPLFSAYQVALSDYEGVAQFQVSCSSASSSLLPLDVGHIRAYPEITVQERIEVPVTTLDRWAVGRQLPKPMLLKMDVQGNELATLRGGLTVVAEADYVLTEVCFAPLYKGQPSFDDLYDVLHSSGFEFVEFFASGRDTSTLRCLFGDALFARPTLSDR